MASNTDVRQLLTSIRKGDIRPVYLLAGQDTYFIDIIVEALEKHAVSEEDKDFNFNLYYGIETNADIVINCAQQFPVLADRKLVVLKESQGLPNAKAELDKFCTYVSRPNMNTTLVITYTSDKTAALTNLKKAIAKSDGVVLECNPPRDYELPGYVKEFCQQRRMGIEDKAVNMLCEYIGGPLSKLFGELKKLVQIVGDAGRITAEDVERNIGISKDYNNFELVNALRRRDYPKCMAIVNYFRNNPRSNPTVVTTATLFNFFSQITLAHFLPSKDDTSLSTLLTYKNRHALEELKAAMRAYPPVKAINGIHYLREFDAKIKGIGSFGNEYDLLQELIFKLMT